MNHRFEVLGVAFDGQDNGAFFDAVSAGCGRGNNLPAVGQAEPHGEGAVGAELDRLALESDLRGRFGSAVDNQFGIELEPELPRLAVLKGAGAEAGDCGRAHGPAQAFLEELLEFKAAGGGVE